MTTTFVTAFYSPGHQTVHRDVSSYFSNFERLANTGIPIWLYLDVAYKDQGEALTRTFKNVRIPEYVVLDVIRGRELPCHRDRVKDTDEYYSMQLSKLHLVAKAAETCPTPFVAWIDFGVFHMIKDDEVAGDALRDIAFSYSIPDTILTAGYWSADLPETWPGRRDWNYTIWEVVHWVFLGSIFLGPRHVFREAAQRQTQLVQQYAPKLTWEVNYWMLMKEHFTQYHCESHSDTILTNLRNFLRNLK
jgi:hypothetical protein